MNSITETRVVAETRIHLRTGPKPLTYFTRIFNLPAATDILDLVNFFTLQNSPMAGQGLVQPNQGHQRHFNAYASMCPRAWLRALFSLIVFSAFGER